MASSGSRLFCRCLVQVNRHIPAKRKPFEVVRYRQLSSSIRRLADDDLDKSSKTPVEAEKPFVPQPFSLDQLDREGQEHYDTVPAAEQERIRQDFIEAQHTLNDFATANADSWIGQLSRDRELRNLQDFIDDNTKPAKNELGYWGEDEDDEMGITPDGEDGPELDITSIAHDELELHRELREYARLAAWDMPHLAKYQKAFESPTQETPLRFRYTSYMGDKHPSEPKVVVEFSPKQISFSQDLKVDEANRLKLKKLVGARYRPDCDMIHLSCEKFKTREENKQHLLNLVQTLIAEAKDTTDTFEDIPLDLRHHKKKPPPKFPDEWKLSPIRSMQGNMRSMKELAAPEPASSESKSQEAGEAVELEFQLESPRARAEREAKHQGKILEALRRLNDYRGTEQHERITRLVNHRSGNAKSVISASVVDGAILVSQHVSKEANGPVSGAPEGTGSNGAAAAKSGGGRAVYGRTGAGLLY